tara:strand:- start:319 stop:480 length:162 start_codon:yes stop_codon:yes gene_type:complete
MSNEKDLYLVTWTMHQYVEASSEAEAIAEAAEAVDYGYTEDVTAERLRDEDDE